MSMATNPSTSDLLRRSVRTIQSLRTQLENQRHDVEEPIAVIGMACRFPGSVDGPESFWEMIRSGQAGVSDVPPERWDVESFYSPAPGRPGRSYIRQSNFLGRDVGEFDARFFAISPREANSMDPQQRLLLETTWEALENAGQQPEDLRGSKTGVYLGISSNGEYSKLVSSHDVNDQYLGTGNNSSIASGRISYSLGLHGPAVSVDTACSSSLVCVHLATEALRRQECDVALVSGVNLMLAPQVMAGLCAMNALAPDGKSKPFDASADGYGRGEGCGVVILKRLQDAQSDGDNIHALIRGGAVNNDGETSGLTVPNGMAQRAVLRQALVASGVDADDVDYLEAHGTGTLLGDPIEVDAIRSVYCEKPRTSPLSLGAVKGNIGHLESAAGVASLIKAVLCLKHGEIPAIAGLQELNPRIRPDSTALAFPTQSQSWPTRTEPRRAAVSSFGFSGTNAHILLEQAPSPRERTEAVDEVSVLQVSAKSAAALLRQVGRMRDYIAGHSDQLADICFTANVCRPAFEHRVILVGSSATELCDQLDDVVAHYDRTGSLYSDERVIPGSSHGRDRYGAKRSLFTTTPKGAHVAHVDAQIAPKLAFIIGNGDANSLKAARALYASNPGFAAVYQEVAGNSFSANVVSALSGNGSEPRGRSRVAVQFCIAQSMIGLMKRYGITPDLVVGDGIGRLAAAVASGVIPHEEATEALGRWTDDPSLELAPLLREVSASRPAIRYQSPDLESATASTATIVDDITATMRPTGIDDAIVARLHDQGYRFFVEVNSDELESLFSTETTESSLLLTPARAEPTALWDSLAQLAALGATLDWSSHYSGQSRTKMTLPNYPFEPSRFWLQESSLDESTDPTLPGHGLDPLRFDLPLPGRHRMFVLDHQRLPDLTDNSGVLHVGHYVEMLTDAITTWFGAESFTIRNMDFVTALLVQPEESKEVALLADEGQSGLVTFSVHSRSHAEDTWSLNAEGQIELTTVPRPNDAAISVPDGEPATEREEVYEKLTQRGFRFGPAVRWIDRCLSGPHMNLLRLGPDQLLSDDRQHAVGVNPGMLDSCAQAVNLLAPMETADTAPKYLLDRLRGATIWPAPNAQHATAELSQPQTDEDGIHARLALRARDGSLILRAEEIHLAPFDEAKFSAMRQALAAPPAQGENMDHGFRTRLSNADPDGQSQLMTTYVIGLLAETLQMSQDEIQPSDEVSGLGLDSMTGVVLMDRFSRLLGISLTMAELIHCDTVDSLAEVVKTLTLGEQIESAPLQPVGEVMDTGHWVRLLNKSPDQARIRLFCFPNGYRSADMFDHWQDILGPDIDVCPIKLPGLDAERMTEEAPLDVDECVSMIRDAVADDLLDLPCATFGHSWGSLFSFRLAKILEEDPRATFLRAFVAGYTPPNRRNSLIDRLYAHLGESVERIPTFAEIRDNAGAIDAVVAAYVKAWGYTEADTRVTLPLLLAACCAIDRYTHDDTALASSISAFHGLDDYDVAMEEMLGWQNLTQAAFRFHTLAGDHQFINAEQSEAQVLERIVADLSTDLPSAHPEH